MSIIHKSAQIGDNCTIYHEVTIGCHKSQFASKVGNNHKSAPLREICDNTLIEADCIILKSTPINSHIIDLFK